MSKSCLFIAALCTTNSLFFSANSGISSSTCGDVKFKLCFNSGSLVVGARCLLDRVRVFLQARGAIEERRQSTTRSDAVDA